MFFLFGKNKKELETIFNWLSTVVDRNDLILVERGKKQEIYRFEFPLKFGDKPEKIKVLNKSNISFLIKFSQHKLDIDKNGWHLIFQSPTLGVYENRKNHKKYNYRPLYLDLNEREKKTALKIARISLEFFLRERKPPKIEDIKIPFPYSPIFNQKADINVALWVKGMLRGSWVAENKTLKGGVIEASVKACRDSRFKPLKAGDLSSTRIEIALISDLKIPLGKDSIERNEIFYEKGYLLENEDKKGLFTPEIFNILAFKDLRDLLHRLASEKAFLPAEMILDKKTKISIFEVKDFVEGAGKDEKFLDLYGPVAKIKDSDFRIKESAESAADWLLRMQESDGNFIPVFNPLTGAFFHIDWARSAFSGWSLAEFGRITDKSIYLRAAQKNFNFLKEYFLEDSLTGYDFNRASLVLAYLGQEALTLNCWQKAVQSGLKILEKEEYLKFEPILFLQIGSFLNELSKKDREFHGPSIRFTDESISVFENVISGNQPVNLAIWAELVNLSVKTYKLTGDRIYLETARKITDWLLSQQFESGAFKTATNSNFCHTRSTGKVIEAIAGVFALKDREFDGIFDLPYYEKCLKTSFGWLKQMQYSSANSYFIPVKNLKFSLGGIRHDYLNSELWIDSVGHFLLATSRILKFQDKN
jgi:AMMECR1 domain-containing protein